MRWAAKWLGVSEHRVRQAIARGELDWVNLGNDPRPLHGHHYRVTLAALEDFVMRRSLRMGRGKGSGPDDLEPLPVPPSSWLKEL